VISELIKMGLRGITVLFASGDQGIGGAVYMSPSSTDEQVEKGCSKAWPGNMLQYFIIRTVTHM
jgi:hypothetical protein